jgi:hypothetical protein
MQYGLEQGHFIGVIGSTDHHSAHPGSYGHGRTGLWATAKTRQAIWDALNARRTFALTGDRIALQFAINGQPMGSRLTSCPRREIEIHVVGGAPIDCVDVLKNGRLVRRFSEYEMPRTPDADVIHTKLYLDVGWGKRKARVDWDVHLGISDGRILSVEPRFRGQEVVAPSEKDQDSLSEYHTSHWEPDGEGGVWFQTITFSNPNNSTNASQGMCIEVEMPIDAHVVATINGQRITLPLHHLLEGARAFRLRKIGSASYRFHRAPRPWEFDWSCRFQDVVEQSADRDVYYVRMRQKNDQWAWSSPILVG